MGNKIRKYTSTQLARMFNKKLVTVAQRFVSPYAKERWGVMVEKRPDGSVRRFVPEDKLPLWEADTKYVGRPRFDK